MYYVPNTAREIVESLIVDKNYSAQQIANELGITRRTIYRIRKGINPTPQTYLNLIHLYITIQQQQNIQIKEKEEVDR